MPKGLQEIAPEIQSEARRSSIGSSPAARSTPSRISRTTCL
jgi:hypothetical protein